jgi:hypothetical protein
VTEFERTRFFFGKLLTAEDLEREQRYHIEKRWLLNRMLHGPGVVSGLEVTPRGGSGVRVAPGLALDAHGRELLLCRAKIVAVPPRGRFSICLRYAEIETSSGTIRETFELTASPTGREPPEAVVLARLRRQRGKLVVAP